MSQQDVDQLLKAFKKAIEKKKDGKFGEADIQEIYAASDKVFDAQSFIDQAHIDKIRDHLLELAEGHIDKGAANRKMQGTSRAEAIRSVLKSML